MTIDERIEALTHTLEVTVLENRDRDARWDKLTKFVGESLAKLANTAILHQHRLDSQDDRLDSLEGEA